MHDTLRNRLLTRLEGLPEAQLYQVLDYIEFLESRYARDLRRESSGLQKFAEKLEDGLRMRTVSPATLREAFQLIAAADRVLSNVSNAGKQMFSELNGALDPTLERPGERAGDRQIGAPSESDDSRD